MDEILKLMFQSRVHKHWTVEDIYNIIIPPIVLGHFVMAHENGKLVGIGTWAFLSDETMDAFINRTRKLEPKDFNGGTNLAGIDIIAPYGHLKEITSKMRKALVAIGQKGKSIKFIRDYPSKKMAKELII